MSDLKILVNGISIYTLTKDLELSNKEYSIFDKIIKPNEREHGFTVTPEIATIVVSGLTNIVLLISVILSHLEKNKKSFTFKMGSSSGETYEFTSETPEKTRNEFIELVKKSAINRIELDQKK